MYILIYIPLKKMNSYLELEMLIVNDHLICDKIIQYCNLKFIK